MLNFSLLVLSLFSVIVLSPTAPAPQREPIGNKASRHSINPSKTWNSWLDLRRNMTLATVEGFRDYGHFMLVKIDHLKQRWELGTLKTKWLKHGKMVRMHAFHRGEQVYIVPRINKDSDLYTSVVESGPNAIAVSNNFADAARALKKATVIVTGKIAYTETVSGRIYFQTKDGKILEVSIYQALGTVLPGGSLPSYKADWSTGTAKMQARLLHVDESYSMLEVRSVR
ncbi:MAG TPA: hypothetical protein VFA07_09780 [Chthonomonadaceae bacterium]|nr:hypothetical protein [Chthonomonadaceae bacterium]